MAGPDDYPAVARIERKKVAPAQEKTLVCAVCIPASCRILLPKISPKMAHIKLTDERLPGISGLLHHAPHTAEPLLLLAETLLRGPSSLTMGERELIAASVSCWNGCHFCFSSHAAAAAAHLERGVDLFDEIRQEFSATEISEKLRALLRIARAVQVSGKSVTPELMAAAREEGATDAELHDTVLIAAAFCMFNRYVDGLGTEAPAAPEEYVAMGERMARTGYVRR